MSDNWSAVGEQIIKSSITTATISNVDPKTGITINTPILIGGDYLIKDDVTRNRVEQGFGQLNIMDLFLEKQYILHSASYMSEPLSLKLSLTPNLYLVKIGYENTYILSLLITPYSDINLTELTDELLFIGKSYHGTFIRTLKQMELGYIDDVKRRAECDVTLETLMSLLHYRIFNLRRLRGGIGSPKKPSYFSLVLFVKGKILRSDKICLECGTIFRVDDVKDNTCPSCGKPLVDAPPIIGIEDIALGYPEIFASFASKNNLAPLDYLTLYISAEIPSSVKIAIHQINPEVFSSLLTLPRRAIFSIKNSDDLIDLFSLWFVKDSDVNLVVAFSDSRLEGYGLPSFMSEHVFIRDLAEGLARGISYEQVFRKSVTKTWYLSDYISLKEFDENPTLNSWESIKNAFSE